MTERQADDGQRIVTDCDREANPHYGFVDRIAVTLFPVLDGRPDREAGE